MLKGSGKAQKLEKRRPVANSVRNKVFPKSRSLVKVEGSEKMSEDRRKNESKDPLGSSLHYMGGL